MRPKESFVAQPIRSLQTMLRVIAEDDPSHPTVIPDGIYGPETMAAVSHFQRRHGLGVSGITDQDTWEAKLAHCFDLMYKKAEELGGLVSGEHGIGYAKKGYMRSAFGEDQIALMQGIKAAFDKKNILNPGKVCY